MNKSQIIAHDAVLKKITDLYNNIADLYDRELKARGYYGPDFLYSYFGSILLRENSLKNDILELGCGTGFCGELFKEFSSQLHGVDISQSMIDKAREKNVYDELYVNEMCCFLENLKRKYNIIISIGVIGFYGDLEDIFQKAYNALEVGGYFCFTLDRSLRDEISYELQDESRPEIGYYHGARYTQEISSKIGFNVLETINIIERKSWNTGIPIEAIFFVLRK